MAPFVAVHGGVFGWALEPEGAEPLPQAAALIPSSAAGECHTMDVFPHRFRRHLS